MKFEVYGTAHVSVCMTVEAEDADEAIEIAYQEFGGLTNYAGNGGLGKLVGTSQSGVKLDVDEHVEFNEAEPA